MSKILETLIEHEIEMYDLKGIVPEQIPRVANKIEAELQNLGIYIGDVNRYGRFSVISVETPNEQKTTLSFSGRNHDLIYNLSEFTHSVEKLDAKDFPKANQVCSAIKDILEDVRQNRKLSLSDVPPLHSRSRKDVYWVCIYRDEIEPHGNDDNLVQLELSEKDLRDFVKENTDWPSIDKFLEEYTADDTDGLVEFLQKRDHYVVPEEVLYTRAIIDLYEKFGKYDPNNLDMTKDDLHYDALRSSDKSMLYVLKEYALPNVPKSKQAELAEQIKALEDGLIPSFSTRSVKNKATYR